MLVPIVLALGVSDPGAKPKEEGLRLADVAPTKRRLGGDDDDSRSDDDDDDDSSPRDFTFTCKQKYCGCDCTVLRGVLRRGLHVSLRLLHVLVSGT